MLKGLKGTITAKGFQYGGHVSLKSLLFVAQTVWRSGKACAVRMCTLCRAVVAKLTTT